MNRAILLHAMDGASMAARVHDLLVPEPVTVEMASDPALPVDAGIETWEPAVILVLITPGLLAAPETAPLLDRIGRRDIPIIPVVEDLTAFHFAPLERVLPAAHLRNATGLEPNGGVALVEAVRGHLGLESFARDKKVFISYRRSDGERVAREIYEHLWSQKFEAFLDVFGLESGAVVQPRIMAAVAQMDFVLLVDSPDAAASPWVEAEIVEALRCRIPICRVCTGPVAHVPLYPEAPRMDWDPADPHNLEKAKRLVSRGIAARQSHEQRVIRSLATAVFDLPVTMQPLARRQFLLASPAKRVLVESEQAPPSVERLHRLYAARSQHAADEAVLVAGDADLSRVTTREAVEWACRGMPLHVVPLARLHLLVQQLFR